MTKKDTGRGEVEYVFAILFIGLSIWDGYNGDILGQHFNGTLAFIMLATATIIRKIDDTKNDS